jgi:hypothetical protein
MESRCRVWGGLVADNQERSDDHQAAPHKLPGADTIPQPQAAHHEKGRDAERSLDALQLGGSEHLMPDTVGRDLSRLEAASSRTVLTWGLMPSILMRLLSFPAGEAGDLFGCLLLDDFREVRGQPGFHLWSYQLRQEFFNCPRSRRYGLSGTGFGCRRS